MTRRNSIQIKTIQGYTFFFIPHSNKTIHIEAVIHSGFVHENRKNLGINHLLEHVVVSGWKKCKESCNTYWDKNGALVNASTDDTVMKYYIKGNVDDLPDMVNYISSIMTRSLFYPSTLEQEKKAVMEELIDLLDDPSTDVYDLFHKNFYNVEGIQYTEDCKLQIKNLKNITLDDIKKAYEMFNTNNCLFIVYGDYNHSIDSLFKKYLVPRSGKKIVPIDCFTRKHDILYTKKDKEGTMILVGFPSTIQTFFLEYFEIVLHHLLFYELRTKNQYIYDIDIKCNSTRCGTIIEIEINVQTKNAAVAFQCLLNTIRHYQKTLVSDEYIRGVQKTMNYNYHTDYSFVDYYASFIHKTDIPLTKQQIIQKGKTFSALIFKNLCSSLCCIENALCVYQGKHKLNLSW
jgi:predicted Zn-dependent peptidase